MEKIVIDGGSRLNGSVGISGMKNSALPIIFASILVEDDCVIDNVPRVSDVFNALEILRSMGAKAEFCDLHTVCINTKNIGLRLGAKDLVCKMRASSYLMGALLSRFGKVEIPMPGGCNFGARPLDLHFKGFEKMGAVCEENQGFIRIVSKKKLNCNKITLDKISVGATINMVLALAGSKGTSVIENCAMEPHVDDLICFLNNCGADIKRIGTSVICQGDNRLKGTRYRIYPDMIEALTYLTFAGICKGQVHINGVALQHLENEIRIFKKMGFDICADNDNLKIIAKDISGTSVVTAPYPGFPTDLHPQFAALLCFSNGGGTIKDIVFPTRFAYVNELLKMGAKIKQKENTVLIERSELFGAGLDATDLRAGAALIAAALGAQGKSEINNVNYIVRGYESIVDKIAAIGGKIKLVKGE